MIPKPNSEEGLGVGWPAKEGFRQVECRLEPHAHSKDELKAIQERILAKI